MRDKFPVITEIKPSFKDSLIPHPVRTGMCSKLVPDSASVKTYTQMCQISRKLMELTQVDYMEPVENEAYHKTVHAKSGFCFPVSNWYREQTWTLTSAYEQRGKL